VKAADHWTDKEMEAGSFCATKQADCAILRLGFAILDLIQTKSPLSLMAPEWCAQVNTVECDR